MNKKRKLIFLGILAVVIVGILSFSFTKAFMKPIEQSSSITKVSLTSCAKIKLTSESSINLTNSYSMSANSALKQTPYTFSITSYCDTPVTADIMLFSKSTNTIVDANISYIIAPHGAKEVLYKSALPDSRYAFDYDLTSAETSEVSAGMGGSVGARNDIYQVTVPNKGTVTLDLYLYVNEDADNTTMGKTFEGAVAVKANARTVQQMDSVCKNGDVLANCIKNMASNDATSNLYIHDSSLTNGAGDNSYRYSGRSSDVNNYVCFGSTISPCPTDNLYRIIGVFGDKVKLIKYDYATSALLGTDGDYDGSETPDSSSYKGNLTTVNTYYWNYKATNSATNTWSTSLLNKTNLNTNFITNIGTEWAEKIATTTWKVGGNTKISEVVPATTYQNEIVNPVATNTTDNATEYTAKIGLMYASDYGFAADPSAWTTKLMNYDESVNGSTIRSLNWMYMGYNEWTISRYSYHDAIVSIVDASGRVGDGDASFAYVVRPAFYLNSTVKFVQGLGTLEAPIIIE